jgi:hypothetical protein
MFGMQILFLKSEFSISEIFNKLTSSVHTCSGPYVELKYAACQGTVFRYVWTLLITSYVIYIGRAECQFRDEAVSKDLACINILFDQAYSAPWSVVVGEYEILVQ